MHALSRRELLKSTACGFGSLALATLLHEQAAAEGKTRKGPLAPKAPHFTPKAKRVIFLFMPGGPGQMDTFDYKPKLQADHGKDLPGGIPKLQKTVNRGLGKLMASPFKFAQHGESGQWASELFPHVAKHIDALCILKGMHTDGFDHGQATLRLFTGADTFIRPSIGSWISYGLGTENQSLPAFVTICPDAGGGTRKYSNAFLPAIYQGTPIGGINEMAKRAKIRHLTNEELPPDLQRQQLAYLQSLNRDHQQRAPVTDQLEGLIQSFELAFKMQVEAPKVLDLTSEPQSVQETYGIGNPETDDFARQCLMARRMAEAGVRFIQCTSGLRKVDPGVPNWDQHTNLERDHRRNAKAVDQPIAALLSDLKSRGLLDDTLVVWGGEFGRTSVVQSRGGSFSGRDHNPLGFTMWLAGGGVKGGFSYGETDDYGYRAVSDKVHMHDLHATILHLLGLNHEKLTYRYAGRDFRLTDVYGRVVKEIMA